LVTKAFVSTFLKKDSRFSKILSVFLPVFPSLGSTFWPVWQKNFSWGKKNSIPSLEDLLSKSCLSKIHKRGQMFSDIGRIFWLDWPGSRWHVHMYICRQACSTQYILLRYQPHVLLQGVPILADGVGL
jgi:hypothetical protein